nr:MAG TPA: hypothetical protein [Caudoviricetes sp.]
MITPPFHQSSPPTTASFLCAYRGRCLTITR